jgi:CO/xanthine dehydrogenase Mo-binding subunit
LRSASDLEINLTRSDAQNLATQSGEGGIIPVGGALTNAVGAALSSIGVE